MEQSNHSSDFYEYVEQHKNISKNKLLIKKAHDSIKQIQMKT